MLRALLFSGEVGSVLTSCASPALPCPVGGAVMTSSGNGALLCKHVIHAVGPAYGCAVAPPLTVLDQTKPAPDAVVCSVDLFVNTLHERATHGCPSAVHGAAQPARATEPLPEFGNYCTRCGRPSEGGRMYALLGTV